MVPWPISEFYSLYLRVFRRNLQSPFGTLKLFACHPEMDIFWWRCRRKLPAVDSDFIVEVQGTATGPTQLQCATLQLLESAYETILQQARVLIEKHQTDPNPPPPLDRPRDWTPRLTLQRIFFCRDDLLELDYLVDDLLDHHFKVFIRRDLSPAMSGWEKLRIR